MTYPYDEELPYVVARIKKDEVGSFRPGIIARFRTYEDAFEMAENFQSGWVETADTTPKPKIPKDAKFLYWRDEDGQPYYAREVNGDWETDEGGVLNWEEVNGYVGEADVTVLTPVTDTP